MSLKSSLRIASTIMFSMGIYVLAMSLFWIFLTEIIFVSDFLGFTGQSYAEFLVSNPLQAEIYMITKKLLGVTLLLIGILIVMITRNSYGKGEKWSWYVLLITGTMLWGSLIGYRVVIGYVAPSIITFIIGTTLFVIGITLPVKEIMGKS